MASLHIDNLVKHYPGGVAAVDDVSIVVEEGMLLVLLGPSGCGKTTLLRCVAGLEDAQQGTIAFGGARVFDGARRFNVPTHRRDIGLVFQNYSLWPHMTVRKNVEYPLRNGSMDRAARDRRIAEVLTIVKCTHLADRLPSMLSGGQQQRVALARALSRRPAIMLLDEPLSNLDAVLRLELRAQLRAIHRELGFTGIYVTHDQSEAFALGSRVAVMNSGRIEQLGTAPEVYARPATEYVATFLGIRNALSLRREGRWMSAAGPLGGDLGILEAAPPQLALYVRPEHLQLSAAEAPGGSATLRLPGGTVVDALYGGGQIDYVIDMGGTTLYAQATTGGAPFKAGDTVGLSVRHDHALIYADGKLLPRGAAAA